MTVGWEGKGLQAWEDFTPTWTTSGTAPTLGSSFLVGAFELVERTVTVRFRLLAGSGVNFGTGTLRFAVPSGLPPLAEYVTYLYSCGRGTVFDGTTRNYREVVMANAGYVDLRDTGGTAVSGTVPLTLGVGDWVAGQYTYEADI